MNDNDRGNECKHYGIIAFLIEFCYNKLSYSLF